MDGMNDTGIQTAAVIIAAKNIHPKLSPMDSPLKRKIKKVITAIEITVSAKMIPAFLK